MEAIASALGAISIAGGYHTDCGMRVYAWRDPLSEPWQKSEKPACFLRDESSEVTQLDSAVNEHALTVNIGAVVDGFDAVASLRDLESDLTRAIGVDPTFGGNCHFCQITGTQSDFKKSGDSNAVVRMTIEIRFRTSTWNADALAPSPV